MTYHGQVTGAAGQFYQCEHNHRTLTAAITCANSSGTRQMAAIAWHTAAIQAAQAAALAKKQDEEREAAQARRLASQEASEARRAAAQAATQKAKAAKRLAKLAAMEPRRAWNHMTSVERLLWTADLEMQAYGEIRSHDARTAYDVRAAKHAVSEVPAPKSSPPNTLIPIKTLLTGKQPTHNGPSAMAAMAGFSGLTGIAIGIVAGVMQVSTHSPVCAATSPMSCFQAQTNASNAGMPELAIAILLFIIAAALAHAAKSASKGSGRK